MFFRSRRKLLRGLWVGAGLVFTAWMAIGFQATDLPGDVFQNNAQVTVLTEAHGWKFQPAENRKKVGLIFLPGGMVDPAAYAPLMRRIAMSGYPAQLIFLPMRCACTENQAAGLFRQILSVTTADSKIRWVLSGHSRGAMLATRFAYENQSALAGLAPIATTHPRDFSLASLTIPVRKIYGSRDASRHSKR